MSTTRVFQRRAVILSALLLLAAAAPASAQLRLQPVATGLSLPTGFVADPSSPNTFYIVQHGGRIRVLQNGQLLPDDFLNLTNSVLVQGELGLLGMALPPDYAVTGRVFVAYSNLDGHTVISRFNRSATHPLQVDRGTERQFIWSDGSSVVEQPSEFHHGGDLEFGPDGYLYVGFGDGGPAHDPDNQAQNPMVLRGKLVRLDPNVPDDDPYGFVVPPDNPFVGRADVLASPLTGWRSRGPGWSSRFCTVR